MFSDTESRDVLTSNSMVRSILDVALDRIRSNNSEFSNAVLTRAQVRIIGKFTPVSCYRKQQPYCVNEKATPKYFFPL